MLPACSARHAESFTERYLAWRSHVLSIFLRSRVAWLAEDLTADTFLKVWQFKPDITADDLNYVVRTAQTVLQDQFRNKKGRVTRAHHDDIASVVGPTVRGLDFVPDVLAVRDAIGSLTPTQAQVASLHYFDELTLPEVAVRLGQTRGAAKYWIASARAALREQLAQAS